MKWALVIKEEINFRQQICFQTVVLCCWWYVVDLVTVHKDLDNHMVLTYSPLLCSLASKVSFTHEIVKEWPETVVGKGTEKFRGTFSASYPIIFYSKWEFLQVLCGFTAVLSAFLPPWRWKSSWYLTHLFSIFLLLQRILKFTLLRLHSAN